MSNTIRGFCGYRCDLCPAYIGNIDRIANKTLIRKGWNTFFGFDVSEERIMCVGCHGTGNHLDTGCPVRSCAQQRKMQDCSFCDKFESCATLPLRADILDETRKKYTGKISPEEYRLFFRPYEGRSELLKKRKKR